MKTNEIQIFNSYNQAINALLAIGGQHFQRPKNVPLNWKILLLTEYKALLYFNPEDENEFVKVMPPRLEYSDSKYHEPYAIYHSQSRLVSKEYQNKIMFCTKNNDHMKILNELNVNFPNNNLDLDKKRLKAAKAGELLGDFWFELSDLQFIRNLLGFNQLPQNLVDHINKITCGCHSIALSDSQGGIIFRHREHHYYHTRIAHHLEKNSSPFVKAGGTRGYHTSAGNISRVDAKDTHLEIHEVLGNPFDWNLTPCKMVYKLKSFNYVKAKEASENQFNEKNKKSHLYV